MRPGDLIAELYKMPQPNLWLGAFASAPSKPSSGTPFTRVIASLPNICLEYPMLKSAMFTGNRLSSPTTFRIWVRRIAQAFAPICSLVFVIPNFDHFPYLFLRVGIHSLILAVESKIICILFSDLVGVV